MRRAGTPVPARWTWRAIISWRTPRCADRIYVFVLCHRSPVAPPSTSAFLLMISQLKGSRSDVLLKERTVSLRLPAKPIELGSAARTSIDATSNRVMFPDEVIGTYAVEPILRTFQ